MTRLVRHVRANAVAYLALTVALSGTSYAAIGLGPNSVGAAQIKNHSIDPVKLDPRVFAGFVRHWVHVSATGRVIASSGGAKVTFGAGTFQVSWQDAVAADRSSGKCVPLVTVDNNAGAPVPPPGGGEPASGADASVVRGPGLRTTVFVTTYNGQNQAVQGPFYLLVACG
jgi:hypothetical protein